MANFVKYNIILHFLTPFNPTNGKAHCQQDILTKCKIWVQSFNVANEKKRMNANHHSAFGTWFTQCKCCETSTNLSHWVKKAPNPCPSKLQTTMAHHSPLLQVVTPQHLMLITWYRLVTDNLKIILSLWCPYNCVVFQLNTLKYCLMLVLCINMGIAGVPGKYLGCRGAAKKWLLKSFNDFSVTVRNFNKCIFLQKKI